MRQFTQSAAIRETFAKNNRNKKILLLMPRLTSSVLFSLFANTVFAQIISWDFGRETGDSLPSVKTANISVSDLTVKNNNGTVNLLSTTSPSSGYTGASGNYNAGAAVPLQTFNPITNTYFEFTLTPAPGFSVTINSINFGSRSTSTGPQLYSIRSALDSYNSDIASGSFNADSKWYLLTNTNLAFSNTNAVTIRIYGYGNTGSPNKSQANWRLDDLSLSVSVNQVIQSFRSRQNGNWKSSATWESSADEINWNLAQTFPGKDDSTILIQKGHTVIVNSDVYLDQTSIEGTLELQTGGVLNINDGSGDDIKIASNGNLLITSNNDYATSIQQAEQASCNILTSGKITIGNGGTTASGYERFATSDKNKWNNGAVFEYNSSSTFSAAALTFFPTATTGEIPVFKVSKVGGSVAAALSKDFLLNGILEVSCDVTFTGAGKKTFRNGIRGTAVLSQLNAGKFYLTGDNAILDGSSLKISLTQPMDLAPLTVIPSGANVTISGANISNSSKILTINGVLDLTTVGITNSSGVINLNGSCRTANVGGFSGSGSSIVSGQIILSAGSTIELYANGDQALNARKDFSNLIFSGSGKKIPVGPFNPAGTVTIKENAIFDCSGKNIGDETNGGATSTNLSMSDNSRLIVDTYGPNPKMGGTYTITGGVIEFKGSGATPQTIRSKNYQNIEVTGTNVLISEGNIYLNDKGTFTIKPGAVFTINDNTITGNGSGNQKVTVENGGTFRCGNNMGFNGAMITSIPIRSSAINADITNISLQENSTVQYIRNADQSITNANGLLYQNLVLTGSGNKTAPKGNLFIQGNFLKTGTTTFVHNNGTVIFNGSAAQTFSSLSPSIIFYNLTNQNTLGLEINSGLSIYRKLSLEDNSKTLLNEDITFLSNKNQTAFISRLSTNVNIVYNNGRFVVERFINTNPLNEGHPKSWQFLATPAFGETIFNTWQEKGNCAIAGYGTWITGTGGVDKGFDATSAAPSVKYYNEETNSWIGIPTTDINLENKKGYMIFIRGDRTSTLVSSTATPTVMRIRGKLYSPAFPPPLNTVAPNRFQSMGNPYASAIDFSKLQTSNIGSYYIAWDPTLGGDYGLGGYQTISAATNYKAVPGNTSIYNTSSDYRSIQSGQAFFVYNFTKSDGFVSFSEDCKLEDNHYLVNRTSETEKQILFTNLITENGRLADGNAVAFDGAFSDKINGDDALKQMNGQENFGIAKRDIVLAVEARDEIKAADTLFYYINNLRKQKYLLTFKPEKISQNADAFLIDQYLNTETKISMTDTSSFNFSVNSDEGSCKQDRFYLIFRAAEIAKVFSVRSMEAILEGKNVKLQWQTENENSILYYEIEHSIDGIYFTGLGKMYSENSEKNNYNFIHSEPVNGKNYYRLKIVRKDGSIEKTTVINIFLTESKNVIYIYPNPIKDEEINIHFINQQAGKYMLVLYNSTGQKIMWKEIYLSIGNAHEKLFLERSRSAGILHVEVIKPKGSKVLLPVAQ